MRKTFLVALILVDAILFPLFAVSSIDLVFVLITVNAFALYWYSGWWKYLFTKQSEKERERVEKRKRAERIQKRLEAKEEAQRTTLGITTSVGGRRDLSDPLLSRPKVLEDIAKFTVLTKDDFGVSKEWIDAAVAFGLIEPTNVQGLYEVNRDTLIALGIEPSYEWEDLGEDIGTEILTLPDDLMEAMYAKGMKTIGMLAFRTIGPMLGYTIGYSTQTDLLSDPGMASKTVTGLSAMGKETGVLRSESLNIVAAEVKKRDKTHYVYAEPIGKVTPKVKKTVERIREAFNRVDGKYSFKLAVVKALGGEPRDELEEKVAEEEKEYLSDIEGIEEMPEASLPEGMDETEEGVAPPATKEVPRQTDEGEQKETEELAVGEAEELPESYEGFEADLDWLRKQGEVSSGESAVMIKELDASIKNRIQKSLRTARRRRKKLEEDGYIATEFIERTQTSRVWLTEKGKKILRESG